ncbi:MAG: 3-deoxy-D-manno-octulosonate 8-phosphate phosphatase [Porphyromonadaceae bacterium]|nr:MAG: 3-deoxy-D-manno-octulosonate 8-phosphate phosphatase [Porphyromonadaceae bacterium]
MSFFKEDLRNIKAFVFDVDGVISTNQVLLHASGDLMRSINTRDGFAIKTAIEAGFKVGIITGARSESLRLRFKDLGTEDVFLGSLDKLVDLKSFVTKCQLQLSQILYMGDDIPDLGAMKEVGMPTCPNDATNEVQAVSRYISNYPGGHGCVRDVIEQVLRTQGFWNYH